MKKVFIFLPVLFLVACAGNPPEWWNPSGRYNQAASQSTPTVKQSVPRTQPVVKEETIDPLPDNSYEEEVLTPLPEEEDTPAAKVVTEPALDGNKGLPAPSVLE